MPRVGGGGSGGFGGGSRGGGFGGGHHGGFGGPRGPRYGGFYPGFEVRADLATEDFIPASALASGRAFTVAADASGACSAF